MTNLLKKIIYLMFLLASSFSLAEYDLNLYAPSFPKTFSFNFCQLILIESDISDRILKRERVYNYNINIGDYEQDRKISWIADTFVDKYNQGYTSTRQSCQSTGYIWTSQIIGTLWSDIEKEWDPNFISCLKIGLKHKGFVYYKEKQADPSIRYISQNHPVFNEVNKACGDVMLRIKLNKEYKCTTNLGATLCSDKLVIIRNGKTNFATVNEAVIAKLNGEEVGAVGYETEKGETERIARESEKKRKAEEVEKRQAWLASPEGKNWTAQQEAQARKEEETRQKVAAVENARIAKEFPFYAVISCGIGTGHMTITACFSGDYGSLEVKNGGDYGLYKIVQIINQMIPNSNETSNGLVINLRDNFEITARNGEGKNLILGLKIIKRSSNATVFQKQVDNFGTIRVKN